jgi:2-methylisocitrate lyase-like PEP mutase family enzyme
VTFQKNGFSAIATSSDAVANSLGYEDGEKMSFDDYLFIIKRILSSVQIPLSVDMETGYGATADEICSNLLKLADLGIAGINIEDSEMNGSGRFLQKTTEFAKKLGHVKNNLVSKNISLFINIRCDTYLLDINNKQKETVQRIQAYETSGADGIFLPCIFSKDDIKAAINSTDLPVNVMCIPGLPDFEILHKLGVKRVSMGGFLFNKIYKEIEPISAEIVRSKNFSCLFSGR